MCDDNNSPLGHFWASFLSSVWSPPVKSSLTLLLQRCRRSSVCSPVMWRWPRGRGLSSTVALRLDILSPMSAGRRTACPSTTLIHTTRWVLHPLCSWSLFHIFSTYMFVLFRHLAGVDVSVLVDSKQKNHILAVLSHALTQTTLLAATAVRWGFMYSLQWGDAEQQWPRIGMITNSHPSSTAYPIWAVHKNAPSFSCVSRILKSLSLVVRL